MSERMASTLQHGGASVAVAALTNVAALLAGARTSLPALSAFAIMAALTVFVGLLLHLTLFSAVLCLDARRQNACRVDVLYCQMSFEAKATDTGSTDNTSPCARVPACGAVAQNAARAALAKLAQVYMTTPMRASVLTAWAALTCMGVIGAMRMRVDANTSDFVPAGAPLNSMDNCEVCTVQVWWAWSVRCRSLCPC